MGEASDAIVAVVLYFLILDVEKFAVPYYRTNGQRRLGLRYWQYENFDLDRPTIDENVGFEELVT